MKHIIKKILLAGLLLSFCGPLVGSSDAFPFSGKRFDKADAKSFTATLCRTEGGTPVYHYRGAIGNNHSTQNVQVYCPLVRDEMNGKLFQISLRIRDNHATKNPICALYRMDPMNGKNNGRWNFRPARNKPNMLFVPGVTGGHSKYASYSIHCQIPPKTSKGVSKIMNIEYSELPKR